MLYWVLVFFIIAVVAAVLMVVMFGMVGLAQIPIQLTPDVREPVITVNTAWPGASPVEVEREIARITVAGVDPDAALVHGRVVGRRRHGLAGLVVCLTDSRGQPIPNLPSATTDRSGYYALPLDAAAFEILRSYRAGAFLAVFDGDGNAVYRSKQSLPLEPGARLVEEVVLTRRPPVSDGRPTRRRKAAAKKAADAEPPKPTARRKKSASKKATRPKRKK